MNWKLITDVGQFAVLAFGALGGAAGLWVAFRTAKPKADSILVEAGGVAVGSLNKVIGALNLQLERLVKTVSDKDKYIDKLVGIIKDRDKRIDELLVANTKLQTLHEECQKKLSDRCNRLRSDVESVRNQIKDLPTKEDIKGGLKSFLC